MSQYSDQINENVVTDESPINDDSVSVQVGSFLIIPYKLQTSKSTVTLISDKIHWKCSLYRPYQNKGLRFV